MQIAPHAIALLENSAAASRSLFTDRFSLPVASAFDEWLIINRTARGMYDRLSLYQLCLVAAAETPLTTIN